MADGDTNKWIGGTGGNLTTWSTATNWSLGSAPVAGEIIVIPATAAYAIAGYDASATAFAGFTVEAGYAYAIGSAAAWLQINLKHVTYFDANLNSTSGQKFLDIDNAANIYVNGAPASPGTGQYGLNLRGDCDAVAATCGKVFVSSTVAATGSIGLGALVGDNLEVNAISVTGGAVTIGAAVTDYNDAASTTLTISGGVVHNYAALASETRMGGTLYNEDGAIAAFTGTGSGTVYQNTGDTMTAMTLVAPCKFDCSLTLNPKVITTINLQGEQPEIYDPNGTLSWTNPLNANNCDLSGCRLAPNKKWSYAAI